MGWIHLYHNHSMIFLILCEMAIMYINLGSVLYLEVLVYDHRFVSKWEKPSNMAIKTCGNMISKLIFHGLKRKAIGTPVLLKLPRLAPFETRGFLNSFFSPYTTWRIRWILRGPPFWEPLFAHSVAAGRTGMHDPVQTSCGVSCGSQQCGHQWSSLMWRMAP